MLEAITIMNNAFKAGMSITQAVDLVAKELEGPISKEFKKRKLPFSSYLNEFAIITASSKLKSLL